MKKEIKNENIPLSYKPYKSSDFSWVNQNENEILAFPKIAIKSIKEKIEIIKKIKKEKRTFENTILAYEEANIEESKTFAYVSALEMLSDKESVREACRKTEVEYIKLSVDVTYDIKLYRAIMDYIDFNFKEEKNKLDSQDLMLVDDINKGFKKMGFHLELEKRNRIKKIEKEISKLVSDYDKNINENKDHILCTKEDMIGVPENIIESFDKVKDKYKITLEYPVYGPVMKYASNRKLREEIYKKFNNSGGDKNVDILKEVIKLRKEKSQILDYKDHSSYVLEHRMAKSSDKPYGMINEVLKKLKTKKEEDISSLRMRAKEDGVFDFKLSDVEYYANKIKEEKYDYSTEEIKEYFVLDQTLDKMFVYFGELFGFVINKSKIKLWHKDATLFEIRNSNVDNNVIAYLALDLYPRDGKYGHACMMPIIHGRAVEGNKKYNYEVPVSAIICNFPKPNQISNPTTLKKAKELRGTRKKISLLNLQEVETLYHEFGHALHSLLTKAKYTSHAGTNVVWDFVEAPSQMMEEFLRDPTVLKEVSSHYETGKSLNQKQIDKILSLENFMKGLHYSRQAMQSMLDLDLYTYKAVDPVAHYHDLMSEYIYNQDKDILFVSRFSHIVSGYDSGYYSYMWAERICKDFYSLFKNAKNQKEKKVIGKKYREEILEKGGSREEELSAHTFLGRPVSNQAFIDDVLG